MKVFKLNDCDWWMAETLQDAVNDAAREFGMPVDEVTDKPYPLSDKQLEEHIFTDREDANSPQRTFKEELQSRIEAGATSEMFASTEY